MKLRHDAEANVILIEPDDPEELVPLDADDAEAMEEAKPRIVFAVSGPTWRGSVSTWFYGEGLIPRLKRSLGT